MLEQKDVQTLSSIPGLSQIPIMNTEVAGNEIVFAVIPHIVRRKDPTEFNGRTLDVGTANSIHLRHATGAFADRESGKGIETVPVAKSPGETSVTTED